MDFATTSEVSSDDVSVTETKRDSKTVDAKKFHVETDSARDELLTEFGKETLRDRYLLPGEEYQDLFARVASAHRLAQEIPHARTEILDGVGHFMFDEVPARAAGIVVDFLRELD